MSPICETPRIAPKVRNLPKICNNPGNCTTLSCATTCNLKITHPRGNPQCCGGPAGNALGQPLTFWKAVVPVWSWGKNLTTNGLSECPGTFGQMLHSPGESPGPPPPLGWSGPQRKIRPASKKPVLRANPNHPANHSARSAYGMITCACSLAPEVERSLSPNATEFLFQPSVRGGGAARPARGSPANTPYSPTYCTGVSCAQAAEGRGDRPSGMDKAQYSAPTLQTRGKTGGRSCGVVEQEVWQGNASSHEHRRNQTNARTLFSRRSSIRIILADFNRFGHFSLETFGHF